MGFAGQKAFVACFVIADMPTRRSFLAGSAGVLTGCLGDDGDNETNESDDEGEADFAVTTSKNTVEPPRDTVEVTLTNEGDGYGGYNPYWSIYRRIGDGWRFVAPVKRTLRAPFLSAGSEETRTFTVDNTDHEARGQNEEGGWTFWGLNPGRYAVEPANGMYAEFDVEGEPPDFSDTTVSYGIRNEDAQTVIYAEEELRDPEPSIRVTRTDADGVNLVEEQLNQLGAVRDAVLHANGEAVVYTDDAATVYAYLQRYASERSYETEDEEPVVFRYEGESYRVEWLDTD
ncbi:MAG: hypothetical protein ACI9QA_000916 [Methanobacteriota archaeon]